MNQSSTTHLSSDEQVITAIRVRTAEALNQITAGTPHDAARTIYNLGRVIKDFASYKQPIDPASIPKPGPPRQVRTCINCSRDLTYINATWRRQLKAGDACPKGDDGGCAPYPKYVILNELELRGRYDGKPDVATISAIRAEQKEERRLRAEINEAERRELDRIRSAEHAERVANNGDSSTVVNRG